MDEVQCESIVERLNAGEKVYRETGDIRELNLAQTEALKETVKCQHKTSARVKIMARQLYSYKNKLDGAKWLAKLLYAIGGVAGGAAVMKILEVIGK